MSFQSAYNKNPAAMESWLTTLAAGMPEQNRYDYIHGRIKQAGIPTPDESTDYGHYEGLAREVIPNEGRFDVDETIVRAREARAQQQAGEMAKSEYFYQMRRKDEEARSAYGGVHTDVAMVPVGAPTPTQSREDIEAKAAYIQRESAQYASQEQFEQAAASVQQYRPVEARGTLIDLSAVRDQPAITPPVLETREKAPLFDPATGKPNIYYEGPAPEPELKRDPKYGLMLRKDIAEIAVARREETVMRSVLPSQFTLSPTSRKARELGDQAGARIRGFTVDTGFLPQEIKESPGYKGLSAIKESAARTAEYVGIVPGTVELMGTTVLKEPSTFPKMVAVGGIVFVGGIVRQAEREPLQLASDVVVSAGIFKGVSRVGAKVKVPSIAEAGVGIKKATKNHIQTLKDMTTREQPPPEYTTEFSLTQKTFGSGETKIGVVEQPKAGTFVEKTFGRGVELVKTPEHASIKTLKLPETEKPTVLTDRLSTPGEELIDIPKARISEAAPIQTGKGRVFIRKDFSGALKSKWARRETELESKAQKHGYFVNNKGLLQVQIQKPVHKPTTTQIMGAASGIRTVNLAPELVYPELAPSEVVKVPIRTAGLSLISGYTPRQTSTTKQTLKHVTRQAPRQVFIQKPKTKSVFKQPVRTESVLYPVQSRTTDFIQTTKLKPVQRTMQTQRQRYAQPSIIASKTAQRIKTIPESIITYKNLSRQKYTTSQRSLLKFKKEYPPTRKKSTSRGKKGAIKFRETARVLLPSQMMRGSVSLLKKGKRDKTKIKKVKFK